MDNTRERNVPLSWRALDERRACNGPRQPLDKIGERE